MAWKYSRLPRDFIKKKQNNITLVSHEFNYLNRVGMRTYLPRYEFLVCRVFLLRNYCITPQNVAAPRTCNCISYGHGKKVSPNLNSRPPAMHRGNSIEALSQWSCGNDPPTKGTRTYRCTYAVPISMPMFCQYNLPRWSSL